MRRLITLVLLASLAPGALACTEDFEPVSEINYLRILGVRADNPRVAPGELAVFDALAVNVEDNPIQLSWEFCPFLGSSAEGYPCVYPEGIPEELLSLLRGEGDSFLFFYPPELLELVDLFCAQSAELAASLPEGVPLPTCSQGYPARVRLTATDTVTNETAVAVKTLYLMPSPGAVEDPPSDNANPRIAFLGLGEEPPERFTVDEAIPLRCEPELSLLESFERTGDDKLRDEEVQLSWFVRNGSLDESVTFWSREAKEPEKAFENEVTADEAGESTVWCVIRDGRGGSDWRRFDLVIE